MFIYSLIFEVLKLNQDLVYDICPRAQRIKSKTYSMWTDDSARGYKLSDFTFPKDADKNCTYPKPLPKGLEEDLIEDLNDIKYLHGLGNWTVVLSPHELHWKIVTEGIWFWNANSNNGQVSGHVTSAGARCKQELPWGSTGFAYSSVGGSSANYKACKMLWNLIDEYYPGMGHRAAMFSPALYQTQFAFGRRDNGNGVWPSLYFGVLSAYYRGDELSMSVLRWNDPNMPRPEFVALPPPGYVDYTLIPEVWTFQSPLINYRNVTYRAYINGTLATQKATGINGGYQDGGDWSTTDGVAFTRDIAYDTAWRGESQNFKPFPWPGTQIHIEVESDGHYWEYNTTVVDCDKVPPPPTRTFVPTNQPTPVGTPFLTAAETAVETPYLTPFLTAAETAFETPFSTPGKTETPDPTLDPTLDPTQTPVVLAKENPDNDNSLNSNSDNSKAKKIGLGVGIPVAILVCAAIGLGIFILVSKGIIGRPAPTPSDEEGIDV